MRVHYPKWLLHAVTFLLIVANVINVAADLSVMGAAFALLVHGPQQLFTVVLGGVSAILQIFVPHDRYARLLKWAALVLFAYVIVALIVPIQWHDVLHGIVQPRFSMTSGYLTTVVAVLDTTTSAVRR